MKINKDRCGIWYEDADGNVVSDRDESSTLSPTVWKIKHPDGAKTYHAMFGLEVTEHIYKVIPEELRKTCKHEHTHKDTNLIKGYKGRICNDCSCQQIRKWYQPWGKKWDDGPDIVHIMDANCHIGGGNENVILGMVNSGDYKLSEAITIYAQCCERCSNVLAYEYTDGKEGYSLHSDKWKEANTRCKFCEDES